MKKSDLINHDKNKNKLQITLKVKRWNGIFKRCGDDEHDTMTRILYRVDGI